MTASGGRGALPASMPDMARYDGSYLQSPFIVYNLTSLDQSAFAELVSDADVNMDGIHLAKPAAGDEASGSDLQAVVQFHVQKATQEDPENEDPEFNPCAFLVATSPDWKAKGVLAVSLNCDGYGKVDSFQMPVEHCTGNLMAIELGESSWDEAKDAARAALPPGPSTSASSTASARQQGTPVTDADASISGWSRDLGHFSVYKLANGVNMIQLLRLLNGNAAVENGMDDWPCRIPPWLTFVHMDDNEEEVKRSVVHRHREYVGQYENFRSDLVVAAETPDFQEHGLLLGHIKEDGVLGTRRVSAGDATRLLTAMATGEEPRP